MCLAACPMWRLAALPLERPHQNTSTQYKSISSKSGWRLANQPDLPSTFSQLPVQSFSFGHCQLLRYSNGLSCSSTSSWMANFFLPASILSCICPGSCSNKLNAGQLLPGECSQFFECLEWIMKRYEEHSLIWVSLHSAGNSQGPSVWTSFLVDSIAG